MSLLHKDSSGSGEIHTDAEDVSDDVQLDDDIYSGSSKTRQWLRRLAGPITLLAAVGAVLVVKDMGGSDPTTAAVPASTAPSTAPSTATTTPKQLLVNNICNAVADTGVDKLLSNKVGTQITRQCFSTPTNGVISEGFWAYDSGLTVEVAVLDDNLLAGQTVTTDGTGSPIGLTSFDFFSSSQAVTHFSVTSPSGHEYQAAASHNSVRIKASGFVLAVTFGEATPQPGHQAFTAPDLGSDNFAGITEFSGKLADNVFSYS